MHEHVFVLSPEITDNYPEVWGDEARREADAIARLNDLKSRGVDSIVDLTVVGLGRYIPRIARIAAAAEINIVVATGVYTYNDVPMYFHFSGPGTVLAGPEPMVDMFVRDIEHGITDTGVKAAILKCATDEPGGWTCSLSAAATSTPPRSNRPSPPPEHPVLLGGWRA